jgi:hypothetical protein
MTEAAQGDDRHAWETEYEALADDLRTDPADALSELLDLVERMLRAAGYEDGVPGAPDEPEVGVVLDRAREVVERNDGGTAVDNDDALQAAAELRSLYHRLLDAPEAEAGADLRDADGGPGDPAR